MISIEKLSQQKPYESFVLLVRRHWIVLAEAIVMLMLQIVLPLAVLSVLAPIALPLFAHSVLGPALLLLLSLYSLGILLFFLVNVMNYYLDVWIITNERLINIEQHGLFSRSVAELRYYRVQDIKSEVSGFFPTLFNYGTITVETAAAEENFILEQIPHTQIVARRLQELIENDQQYHAEKKKQENAQ